jgi:hypothetical protein|tara:strand:- start:21 stop:476 length:456 start_codon:yes stop_codon:yes gene_type:complete
MNFKKGNFVDPSSGFKQGQFKDFGSINQAPSKVTSFMRQFKSNPKYSFARNLLTGLSFVPIGRIGAGALKIFKSKTGVSTAKTIGSKLPSKSSTEIINNRVNQNIKELTKDVPVIGTNRTMKVPLSSNTKGVYFGNPRISMTAAERRAAGY